jgi:hypothetical protein
VIALACAIWADDSRDPALGQRDVDAEQYLFLAVERVHFDDAQHGRLMT